MIQIVRERMKKREGPASIPDLLIHEEDVVLDLNFMNTLLLFLQSESVINLVLAFSLEVSVDASHVILGFLRTREAENHRVMWAGNVLKRFSIKSEHFAALHTANAKFSEIL